MAGGGGWKQPPAGVPTEPDQDRSYVPLIEAAQRRGVDRRTLLRAVKRGDTAGWARPGPDNLRWYVYEDTLPSRVSSAEQIARLQADNADLRARLASAEESNARLQADNADLRARLVSAEESNLLLIAAQADLAGAADKFREIHADLSAAADKYRQALSLYMTPGHVGELTHRSWPAAGPGTAPPPLGH